MVFLFALALLLGLGMAIGGVALSFANGGSDVSDIAVNLIVSVAGAIIVYIAFKFI